MLKEKLSTQIEDNSPLQLALVHPLEHLCQLVHRLDLEMSLDDTPMQQNTDNVSLTVSHISICQRGVGLEDQILTGQPSQASPWRPAYCPRQIQ